MVTKSKNVGGILSNTHKKIILAFIFGILVSGTSVYAVTKYKSSDITYKDTNVENALNKLYDDSIYIPELNFAHQVRSGGSQHTLIKTNNKNKLSIDSRKYSGKVAYTYFIIRGYSDEFCKENSTDILRTSEQSTSQEIYDISQYKCLAFQTLTTSIVNGNDLSWYNYTFNGINLFN